MIHVSQGHEKGIGIEIFLKSFLSLPLKQQNKFIFYGYKDSISQTLKKLNYKFNIKSDEVYIFQHTLKCKFLGKVENSQTLDSLEESLKCIKPRDILLTLPSSKDQFTKNNFSFNGHTEYFREKFKDQNITMAFLSSDSNFLLLTDHIDIKNVSSYLSEELIFKKVKNFLEFSKRPIREIFFSGINPHCGENGLISNDDIIINKSIIKLRKECPNYIFHDMRAGDTLHFSHKDPNQLFIYASHDQGLGVFKLKNGLTGINTTLGLPFIRVSVDHGTAFDLYGKNQANYIGMIYLINEILKWT